MKQPFFSQEVIDDANQQSHGNLRTSDELLDCVLKNPEALRVLLNKLVFELPIAYESHASFIAGLEQKLKSCSNPISQDKLMAIVKEEIDALIPEDAIIDYFNQMQGTDFVSLTEIDDYKLKHPERFKRMNEQAQAREASEERKAVN